MLFVGSNAMTFLFILFIFVGFTFFIWNFIFNSQQLFPAFTMSCSACLYQIGAFCFGFCCRTTKTLLKLLYLTNLVFGFSSKLFFFLSNGLPEYKIYHQVLLNCFIILLLHTLFCIAQLDCRLTSNVQFSYLSSKCFI